MKYILPVVAVLVLVPVLLVILRSTSICRMNRRLQALQTGDPREIVRFRTYWTDGTSSDMFIMRHHIKRMLTAQIQLYGKPGIQPHNGEEMSPAARISIWAQHWDPIKADDIEASGPFWWTTPGLQRNGDPNGALVFDVGESVNLLWVNEVVLWVRQALSY